MAEDRQWVNTPMDERHLDALEFVKRSLGFTANTDAVRRAVILLAKSLGWNDPQETGAKAARP